MENASPDFSAIQQFTGRVIADAAAAAVANMIYIGDQLGIYRAMIGKGALTCAELAQATRLSERHVRVVQDLIAGHRDRYALCRNCPLTPTGPAPAGEKVTIVPRRYAGDGTSQRAHQRPQSPR